MICTPQLPFHKEGEKIRLVGPVFLSCGCFTGDTLIKCSTGDAPSKDRPIKQLYERWESGFYEKHNDLFVRGLHRQRVGRTKVLDVMYMGKRAVVEVSFADGTKIKCTPDHLFYTNNGWVHAKDMAGEMGMKDPVGIRHGYKQEKVSDPRICVPDVHPYARKQINSAGRRSNVMELHRAMFECYFNGYETLDEWKKNMTKNSVFFDPKVYSIHHIDGDHTNNSKDNLALVTNVGHKKLHAKDNENGLAVPQEVECVSVEPCGMEDVYDISCETYNSFTANGFVVHNCGGVTARFATLQQNLAARIPQAKPKSNKMVNDWLIQERLKEKFPILTKHQYGLVVAETEKGFEGVNIMGGATMNVVNQIADLIRRSNEYRRSNKTA